MPSCTRGSKVAASNAARAGGHPRGGGHARGLPPAPLVTGEPVLAPHARNPAPAGGAAAVGTDPLPRDHVPGPLDEQVAAIGTPRVLPAAHSARDVPGVHELEARLRPDLARPDE